MEHNMDKSFYIIASCRFSKINAAGLRQQTTTPVGCSQEEKRALPLAARSVLKDRKGWRSQRSRHRRREADKKRMFAAGRAGVVNGAIVGSGICRRSRTPALSVITNSATIGTCVSIRRGTEHLKSLYAISVDKDSNFEDLPRVT